MENYSIYVAQVIDGIAYGSIYGLFALSLVLLYRANKIFNFAQTEVATFVILISVPLLKQFSYLTTFILMVIISFIGGVLLHVGVVRMITERRGGPASSQTLVTIGLFSIFNSLSSYFFGDDVQPFPSPFGEGVSEFLGVGISHHSMGVLVVTLLIAVLIFLWYKFSDVATSFEAVAENMMAARLRGIDASNVLALAWGMTIMTCVVGGMLIAPVLFVSPSMLISIFAYSMISTIIGGLESPFGALAGGILVGVTENVASNVSWIGSELKFVAVMVLLLVVLIVRPRGLWGRAEARKV